jgi:hypothetical protein
MSKKAYFRGTNYKEPILSAVIIFYIFLLNLT